jgi:hypothetical protein
MGCGWKRAADDFKGTGLPVGDFHPSGNHRSALVKADFADFTGDGSRALAFYELSGGCADRIRKGHNLNARKIGLFRFLTR